MGLRNRSALSGAEEIQSDSYDDWVGHWEERTHLEASSMPSVFRVYRVNVHAPRYKSRANVYQQTPEPTGLGDK